MKKHFLGSTSLKVTRLGLGMAALGRPAYINLGHAEDLQKAYGKEAMEAHAHTVLDKAWALGIRYFDTARSYGLGEQFLGSWLVKRNLDPSEVAIGSKWGYRYTGNWQIHAEQHEIKEHSLRMLNTQWEESGQILGKQLDLYQIHSATLESGVLDNQAVLDRLFALKKQGVAIGLSISGINQPIILKKALSIYAGGQLLFDTVQATYNLLENSVEPVLRLAHQMGIGVIIKEALANGRLTQRNTHPAFAESVSACKMLVEERGYTVDAFALAFVLSKPWIDVVLSGAAQVPHLLSNVEGLGIQWDESLNNIITDMKESPEVYWGKRKNLKWN